MSEIALLTGVRDHLRTALTLTAAQCEVEIDELPPAVVGDLYVIVMPGGWDAGPRNSEAGGVLDETYGVEITVVLRAPKYPRDRRRVQMLDSVSGINAKIDAVRAAMHFKSGVMSTVNALITNSSEKFVEWLKFSSVERKPRVVGGEYFASNANEDAAGLARTVSFIGARRIQSVSSQV